ncbi:MAG: T9SS type A sorting domain-containing protein [Candidatus Latescibacteria bacterium]|nr:T9SS type A sorting domain-containing protein [bacterium]MBD3425200.1 T9SS type A sorting domain-containing protein [Candidatus Latescibacterota bacterium]
MDTAARWWLGSEHNGSKDSNDYTLVTFYGNRDKYPWQNPGGAGFIANELRACRFAGLGLSWQGPVPWECNQIHVVTAWGDSGDEGRYQEGENPGAVIIADSDNEIAHPDSNLRTYIYDDYDYPVSPNQGKGWYLLDYEVYPSHPYIQNLTTLGRSESTFQDAVTVTGSYRILQDSTEAATGLHYIVGSWENYRILDYRTEISRPEPGQPEITELGEPPTRIEVGWDSLAVTPGTWVLINTELVLPDENVLCYDDIYFTYGGGLSSGSRKPALQWKIDSYPNPDTLACGVCGGYITGAFEVYSDQLCTDKLGEYRFSHEYTFRQDPELHDFTLKSPDSFYLANLRFGHCYGRISIDSLWDVGTWIDTIPGVFELSGNDSIELNLNWDGMLPYPELCITDAGPCETPLKLSVSSVYPNPFNPTVQIEYSISNPSRVDISVYDISGRMVAELVRGNRTPGKYRTAWNGYSGKGYPAASGVYFIRLSSEGGSVCRKVVLLR